MDALIDYKIREKCTCYQSRDGKKHPAINHHGTCPIYLEAMRLIPADITCTCGAGREYHMSWHADSCRLFYYWSRNNCLCGLGARWHDSEHMPHCPRFIAWSHIEVQHA